MIKIKLTLITILYAISLNCEAQIPTVRVSGNTLQGNLPYGRHFKIKGSRILPFNQKAEVIKLTLIGSGLDGPFEAIWWYPQGATNPTDSFEFYIPKHLLFEKNYRVRFDFFVKKVVTEEEIENAIRKVGSALVSSFGSSSFS